MTSLEEDQPEPEEPLATVPALRRSPRTRGAMQAVQHGYNQQMEDLIVLLNYEDLKKTLLVQEIIKETPTVPDQLTTDPTELTRGHPRQDVTNLGNSTRILAAHNRFTRSLASLDQSMSTLGSTYRNLEEGDPLGTNPPGDTRGKDSTTLGKDLATLGNNTHTSADLGNSSLTSEDSYRFTMMQLPHLPLLEEFTTDFTILTISPLTAD